MSRTHEFNVRFSLARIRWGVLSGGGIAATIASGHVRDHTAVWALVVLGVVGQCCEVVLYINRRRD